MDGINLWAVLVAAVSAFALGGIWYGPLFKNAWCREAGVDPHKPNGHPAIVFGGAFALSLLAAAVFAMFLGARPDLRFATSAGFAAGLCWVAASFGINYAFAQRSLKLWMIDAGYHIAQFCLYGLILGAWH